MKKKIGLALGGGGARGLCHIEFIKVFDELRLKPAVLSGTSIGAIVGAFYGAGYTGQDMENLIKELGLRQITKMVDPSIFSLVGLVKGKGIQEFLETYIPVKRFEELRIPLRVVATDFWNQTEVIFDSGELIPAIRASISIPAIFEPVVIDGRVFIDGGVTNPVPYDIIRDECDLLIAVDVNGTREQPSKKRVPNMFESIMATVQILQNAIVESKMAVARPDIYIKPPLKNIGILEFEKYDKILQSARADVEAFRIQLAEWTQKNRGFRWFRR